MKIFETHKQIYELARRLGIKKVDETSARKILWAIRNPRLKKEHPVLNKFVKTPSNMILTHFDFYIALKKALNVEKIGIDEINKLRDIIEGEKFLDLHTDLCRIQGSKGKKRMHRLYIKMLIGDPPYLTNSWRSVPERVKKLEEGFVPSLLIPLFIEMHPDELKKAWNVNKIKEYYENLLRAETEKFEERSTTRILRGVGYLNKFELKYLHKKSDGEIEKILGEINRSARNNTRRTIYFNRYIEKVCNSLGVDPEKHLFDTVISKYEVGHARIAEIFKSRGLNSEEAAEIMKTLGFPAREINGVLRFMAKGPVA